MGESDSVSGSKVATRKSAISLSLTLTFIALLVFCGEVGAQTSTSARDPGARGADAGASTALAGLSATLSALFAARRNDSESVADVPNVPTMSTIQTPYEGEASSA